MLRRIYFSSLFKSSSIYTVDFSLQIIVQICYIFIISRLLGPSHFGIFSSVVSISIIASTLVGVGCDQVLIRNVSHSVDGVKNSFGHGILSIFLTFPLLCLVVMILIYAFIDVGELTVINIILLVSSDLLFTKIVFLSKSCFASHEIVSRQLFINLISTLLKLFFLLLGLYVLPVFNLSSWTYLYFLSNFLSACIGYLFVIHQFGYPKFELKIKYFGIGSLFSIEQISLASIKDVDKPILAYLGGPEIAGEYAIAFRIADSASSPIRGVLYALYIRYFRISNASRVDAIRLALRVLPLLLIIGLALGLFIYISPLWLPSLLGPKYSNASSLLRYFCVYPILFLLVGTASDLLRVLGRQNLRTILSVAGAVGMPVLLYFGYTGFGVVGLIFAKLVVLAIISLISFLFINVTLISAYGRNYFFRMLKS